MFKTCIIIVKIKVKKFYPYFGQKFTNIEKLNFFKQSFIMANNFSNTFKKNISDAIIGIFNQFILFMKKIMS